MTGIGKHLAEARVARGIELAEVEERLKIRAHYLRAMEEERWDQLPGVAYARGFLRAYGDYLGLDGRALARQYSEEHPPTPEPDAVPVHQLGARAQPGRRPALGASGRPGRRWLVIGGIAIAALVAILLVLGLGDGEHESSEPAAKTGPATPASAEPAHEQAPAEPPQRVSLRLTATGAVWVCLVDDDGQPVIQGVTLAAGDKEGPFRARAFEVTFGNGQVEMEANGDPVPVPPAAEPLGYRVTPDKTSELAEAARPTCN
jgi:cytoskeleton protein RodZ